MQRLRTGNCLRMDPSTGAKSSPWTARAGLEAATRSLRGSGWPETQGFPGNGVPRMAPRRPPREARGGRIAAYVTDEQRSAAGGVGVISPSLMRFWVGETSTGITSAGRPKMGLSALTADLLG